MKQKIPHQPNRLTQQLALRGKEPREQGVEAAPGGAIGESQLPWHIVERCALLNLPALDVLAVYRAARVPPRIRAQVEGIS